MKKWIISLLLFLLMAVFILTDNYFNIHRSSWPNQEKEERYQIVLTQQTEEADTYYISLLKQLKEKVDAWLKSLNERIESKDITRLEVRFLEILRNILEWVKEKIDAKIKSLEEERPKKKEKGGLLRETHQRGFSFFEIG
jgi:hypothetical protein